MSLEKRQDIPPMSEPRRRAVAIASRAPARRCDEKALQNGIKPTSPNEPFPPQCTQPISYEESPTILTDNRAAKKKKTKYERKESYCICCYLLQVCCPAQLAAALPHTHHILP